MTPAQPAFTVLEDRGLIRITGADAVSFLQGIVSNDVTKVTPGRAIHAAFLTAQGKYLHDFFIARWGDGLILDCEAARTGDLSRRLAMYKLRAQVKIEGDPALAVYAIFGEGAAQALGIGPEAGTASAIDGGIAFTDPRLAQAGARAVLPRDTGARSLAECGLAAGEPAAYDRHRLSLGLPDGSRDLEIDKSILLECGFEELNGVDFNKGCYLGQEVTARTKHRGLIKKRLLPVEIEGPSPPPGTPLMLGDAEAGEMRSSSGNVGLALIRLELFAKAQKESLTFTADGATIKPRKPEWASI